MPKETIACTPTSNTVAVAWGKDMSQVQISTANPDRLVASTVERVGHGGTVTVSEAPFDGWHADLDRESLNRLIRVLRRARDQAFGRDA